VSAHPPVPRSQLPSALDHLDEVVEEVGERRPAVFLDYDGTLTPIVEHPDLAVLSDEVRAAVAALAEETVVAVLSGRDAADVRDKIALDGIYYAGSHGFDVVGPDGRRLGGGELARFDRYLEPLAAAADEVAERLAGIPGANVERKRFAVAVHYRQVDPADVPAVDEAVRGVGERHPELRTTGGKMIHEFRPDVDWDKGRALLFLLERMGLGADDWLPFYLGDDLTDEDGFEALQGRGIGIVVGRDGPGSHARYLLEDPEEVRVLLERLAAREEARR
jgi:trehalose-phosphatase